MRNFLILICLFNLLSSPIRAARWAVFNIDTDEINLCPGHILNENNHINKNTITDKRFKDKTSIFMVIEKISPPLDPKKNSFHVSFKLWDNVVGTSHAFEVE